MNTIEAEYLKSEEQNIRQIARKRIREIKEILGTDHSICYPGHDGISECRLNKLKVLDIGSNWGWYLDEYRKVGWQAWGIERESCYSPEKQDNVYPGDIRNYDYERSGPFDVITAFCILEHLTINDFYSLLVDLTRAIRPGGLLVIKSPYCKGLTGRFAPEKYYLDPNHLFELGQSNHWIWVLKECHDMKLIKTVIEGNHPERVFPRFGKTKIAKWLTEKLGMGDARCWFFRKEA